LVRWETEFEEAVRADVIFRLPRAGNSWRSLSVVVIDARAINSARVAVDFGDRALQERIESLARVGGTVGR
jgi:hypothetical protein